MREGMEIFNALEERVVRLIKAYSDAQARITLLEEENRKLRAAAGGEEAAALQARIEAMEAERNEARERLEGLLERLAALEI